MQGSISKDQMLPYSSKSSISELLLDYPPSAKTDGYGVIGVGISSHVEWRAGPRLVLESYI